MTETAVHLTDGNLSEMLGGLLRQRTTCAKDLGRRVGVDPRAAEGYRAGRHLPPLPVFLRIVRALGDDIYEAVRDPACAAARLQQEVEDLEAQLAARRAALRDVAGDMPRRPQGVARHEDRAPAR